MIDLNNVKCNATKENLNKLKEFDLEIETNLNTGLEFDAYFYIENNTLRWGHKNCIGTITDKNYWNKYKEIVLVNGEFQYVETKPKNNFKDYGFEADFEGEIYTSYKSNDNQIFYNGAIWFKPNDDYHYMKPVSWTEKGEVIHYHFQESYLTNYSLKPIKKEWYENPDNIGKAIIIEEERLAILKGGINRTVVCIDIQHNAELSINVEKCRPATEEEVLALLVKE